MDALEAAMIKQENEDLKKRLQNAGAMVTSQMTNVLVMLEQDEVDEAIEMLKKMVG